MYHHHLAATWPAQLESSPVIIRMKSRVFSFMRIIRAMILKEKGAWQNEIKEKQLYRTLGHYSMEDENRRARDCGWGVDVETRSYTQRLVLCNNKPDQNLTST